MVMCWINIGNYVITSLGENYIAINELQILIVNLTFEVNSLILSALLYYTQSFLLEQSMFLTDSHKQH